MPIIAEKHLRGDFRITVGLSDEPCTMVSACGSRRVTLGSDNGGKRTIKWRLRTGVNSKRLEDKSAYLTKAPSHVKQYSKNEEGVQKGTMTHSEAQLSLKGAEKSAQSNALPSILKTGELNTTKSSKNREIPITT